MSMAKKQRIDQELFDRLRKSGLRKSVAKQLSTAGKAANDRAPAALRKTLADLGDVLSDLETRVTGPSSRSQAGRKAAATRKRAATKRSAAAKKGAATRARSTRSGSRSSSSRSTGSRSTGSRSTGSRRRTTSTRSRSR
jgi:hypothetical protein